MMPWKSQVPLTSAAIEVFLGLRGEAREKAIATGNYDELMKREPQREPGEDDEGLEAVAEAERSMAEERPA